MLRASTRPWMASLGLQFPSAKSVLLSKPPYLALGCVCACVCVFVCVRMGRDETVKVGGVLLGGMRVGVGSEE